MDIDRQANKLPSVSIVIPVYNAEKYIEATFKALANQTYPEDKFEIIVVDNGSEDHTKSLLEGYDINLLTNSKSKNPYVSRNIGIQKAQGDIIAFLDITCTPDQNWLHEGVHILRCADLAGGRIEFTFSESPSLGEWYDSITFVNVEKYIEEFDGTVAGNLFVKRNVINSIGFFPEDSRSGMDMHWTRKATEKGFNLSYAERAVVYYPARSLKKVLRKTFRVGKGHILSWRKENRSKEFIWGETLKTYSPPSFKELHEKIGSRGIPEMEKKFYRLWIINWLNKIVMAIGRTVAILNKKA